MMRYDFIKPDTFIGVYLASMENNETARAYDFWTACWLICAAVGRLLYVNRPNAPVAMNMYLLLCAESGLTRKSTAVKRASKIVQQFMTAAAPEYLIFEGKIGAAKLEDALSEQTRLFNRAWVLLTPSELITLLGRDQATTTMPGLLTDLYDCPDIHRGGVIGRERKGTATGRTLREVFVSLLSASTPSWLIRAINPDVIEGGFTSRCLFVVEERAKRSIAWPDGTRSVSDAELVGKLVHIRARCSEIHASFGGIPTSDSARRRFVEWYESRTVQRDPYRSSFGAREDHHVLRTAAVLCINDDRWAISEHDINHAIKLIEHVREQGASLFTGGMSSGRVMLGVDRVRTVLIAGGTEGVSQTQLTLSMRRYLNAEQVRVVLAIMHELSLVQKFELAPTRGAPRTIWRATNRLAATGVATLVAARVQEAVPSL